MAALPQSDRSVERFDATELGTDPLHLLANARAVAMRAENAALAPLELDIRLHAVLSLACSGTRPSQRELADYLSLDARQIVYLVDALAERGLVERLPDPADRRANIIEATTAGRAMHRLAKTSTDAAKTEYLGRLSSAQLDDLTRLLRRLGPAR